MIFPSLFGYDALPMRVRFGAGVLAELPGEVADAGLARVLVVCTPGHADLGESVAAGLGARAVGVHAEARMHVPVEVAAAAVARATELRADGCVAVGGGSAIGLGKVLARDLDLPVLAVPTTYAGSEMTPVWGVTEDGRKRTGTDRRVLPARVLYDPELTVGLPPEVSATSGMNAIAHAVEALYAPDTSPIIGLFAAEGVRALAAALPVVVSDGGDLDGRTEALYGAWLCGACLGATTMSLHHKLCHAIGGALDLPHAATHTVVLPHALAYNRPAVPHAITVLRGVLGGTGDPARSLWELAGRLGAPRSLRELGMTAESIPRIVELATANPYANPREVTADGLTALLHDAWAGNPPA